MFIQLDILPGFVNTAVFPPLDPCTNDLSPCRHVGSGFMLGSRAMKRTLDPWVVGIIMRFMPIMKVNKMNSETVDQIFTCGPAPLSDITLPGQALALQDWFSVLFPVQLVPPC